MSSVLVVQHASGGQFTTGEIPTPACDGHRGVGIATVLGVRDGRRLDPRVRGEDAETAI